MIRLKNTFTPFSLNIDNWAVGPLGLSGIMLLFLVALLGCSNAKSASYTMEDYGRVEKIDIQFDQNFEQSMANARHESNRSNEKRERRSRPTQSAELAGAVSEETPEPIRGRQGVLDLVA